jgi:hypothetical protein
MMAFEIIACGGVIYKVVLIDDEAVIVEMEG